MSTSAVVETKATFAILRGNNFIYRTHVSNANDIDFCVAAHYGINRLIDSRNCFELIQKGFVIPKNNFSPHHERFRTLEEIALAHMQEAIEDNNLISL